MLYGPFTIQTHDTDGALTGIPAAGIHYTCDALAFAANAELLSPYRAEPSWPLQFVMAGDDPTSPQNTIPVVFPDDGVAESVIAQLS